MRTWAELLLLAIASAFYPALLAVVIIFLSRPKPMRLLLFFLAGAYITSISIGLVIVFALEGSGMGSSTKVAFNGGVYLGFGLLGLLLGIHFLRTEPKPKKPRTKPSMTQRVLTKDSTWLVFALGIVLNMPGVWYLIGLKDIGLSGYSDAAKVVAIVLFNVIMFSFIELPLLGFIFARDWTQKQANRFNAWLRSHARDLIGWIAVALGCYLITRGILATL